MSVKPKHLIGHKGQSDSQIGKGAHKPKVKNIKPTQRN